MPSAYLQGIQSAFDNQAQIRNDVHAVAINWFVNRCPIVTRLPRVAVGSTTFSMVKRAVRSRIATLAEAVAPGDTHLVFGDASAFMNGDVLELASGERVEILGDPIISTNSVAVRRGAEGTTVSASNANEQVMLIANSRTGGEVDQIGIAFKPVGISQFCQTFQHPVQVGGSLQASSGFQAATGLHTPFEQR